VAPGGDMRKLLILTLALGLAVAVGCSKPPQQDIDAANASLEAARTAGAQDYAPESLQQAEQAKQELDNELQAQQDKFFKSYSKAKELAANAKTAADKAAQDANTGKETMRQEVGTAIQTARTDLAGVRDQLAKAPKGKGTAADLATLSADLDGVDASLNEAQAAYDGQRYAEAKTKVEAANQTLSTVKNDIAGAQAAKAGK
jgi:chromosome segregation ATPase